MSKKPFNFFAGDALKHLGAANNESTNGNRTNLESSSNMNASQPIPSSSNGTSRSEPQNETMIKTVISALKQICESDPARMESMKQHILTLLLSGQSDDMIQGDLIDTFGFEHFELVSEILTQKERVLDELLNYNEVRNEPPDTGRSTPSYPLEDTTEALSNFSVQTKSQQKQKKENRKEQRRAHKEITKIVAGLGETDKLEYQLALRDHERRRYLYTCNVELNLIFQRAAIHSSCMDSEWCCC